MPIQDKPARRTAGRPKLAIYASGVRYAQSSLPHDNAGTPRVVATLARAGGPAGMKGRTVVMTATHADLATLLGAIPASVIPAELQGCYIAVIRWLDRGPLA